MAYKIITDVHLFVDFNSLALFLLVRFTRPQNQTTTVNYVAYNRLSPISIGKTKVFGRFLNGEDIDAFRSLGSNHSSSFHSQEEFSAPDSNNKSFKHTDSGETKETLFDERQSATAPNYTGMLVNY